MSATDVNRYQEALFQSCFGAVIGQADVLRVLKKTLQAFSTRFFIVTGAKGLGKTTLCRAFARYLLLSGTQAAVEQAGTWFDADTHPDWIKVQAESGESVIPVARIREKVVNDTLLLPQFGDLKIYWIDGENLSEIGQNILLKTLEEPPLHTVFLLEVAQADQLLETILSRGVTLSLQRVRDEEIEAMLMSRELSAGLRSILVHYANGCPGRALELAASDWFEPVLQQVGQLLANLPKRSCIDLLTTDAAFFKIYEDQFEEVLNLIEYGLAKQFVRMSQKFGYQRQKSTVLRRLLAVVQEVREAHRMNGHFLLGVDYLLIQLQKEMCHA